MGRISRNPGCKETVSYTHLYILINKPDGSSYNATFYLQMEAKNESEIPDDVNKIKNFITDRNSSIQMCIRDRLWMVRTNESSKRTVC